MKPDPQWLERLLEARARSASAEAAGPCPDPALIAGLVEGRLVDAERDRVVAHLADCDTCMQEVEDLLAESGDGRVERRPALRLHPPSPMRWVAVAASVLVLVGGGLWFALRSTGPDGTDGEHALLAAVAELRQRNPALFEDVTPLGRDERRAAPDAPTRGGTVVFRTPVGRIDAVRPPLAWESVAGASGPYAVEVRGADGSVLYALETPDTLTAWPEEKPDLARGATYVVRVTTRTPLGERRGSATFTVATEAEARLFRERAAEVARTVDDPLRALVLAHVALRAGFLEEAESAARRYLAARPDDAVGRETLYAVLLRLGSPEASAYAPR